MNSAKKKHLKQYKNLKILGEKAVSSGPEVLFQDLRRDEIRG